MKNLVITIYCIALLAIAGCGEEFATGFGSGTVATKVLVDDAQDKFIEAVAGLMAETENLNTQIDAVKDIEVKDFVKPETIEAVENLKSREKDPVTYIALASILANVLWGGKTLGEKKKNES